ncbi:hypothetical protein BGX34_006011 [Mortierella sp. NVP85]|nr:hypothetical protein BGX34_006011 [Mortierella sp. NVP85]
MTLFYYIALPKPVIQSARHGYKHYGHRYGYTDQMGNNKDTMVAPLSQDPLAPSLSLSSLQRSQGGEERLGNVQKSNKKNAWVGTENDGLAKADVVPWLDTTETGEARNKDKNVPSCGKNTKGDGSDPLCLVETDHSIDNREASHDGASQDTCVPNAGEPSMSSEEVFGIQQDQEREALQVNRAMNSRMDWSRRRSSKESLPRWKIVWKRIKNMDDKDLHQFVQDLFHDGVDTEDDGLARDRLGRAGPLETVDDDELD